MKLLKLSVVSFYIFSMLFVCSIILYFQSQPSSSHLGNESSVSRFIQTESQSAPLEKMKTNIFFLKTHKTASSTIFTIFVRFGIQHSLNFMIPKKFDHRKGCSFGYSRPITAKDLYSESVPLDNKFNLFIFHTRYRRATNEFLYPDTMRVTVLRSPPEHFESMFGFAGLAEELNVSWAKFVASTKKSTNNRVSKAAFDFRNKMSRDLGLDKSKDESEEEISELIRFVDEEFHLVMITEYLEASLVLLADLLSWPLHYMASMRIHARPSAARNNISDEDRRTILQHSHADHRLYEHFLAVFRRSVLEYGFERMAADMQRLRAFDQELQKRCIAASGYEGHADTMVYETKVASGMECWLATQDDLGVLDVLKEEQASRLSPITRLRDLVAPITAP